MKPEWQLKLQAYLDGELSGRQARQVAALVESDPEARALYQELLNTRQALTGAELFRALPEAREFYWSKIARAIEQAQEHEQAAPSWSWELRRAWFKYLAPAAGLALVLLAALGTLRYSLPGGGQLIEVENLSSDTSSYSFRSQSDNMFVVWVHEKREVQDPDWDILEPEDM